MPLAHSPSQGEWNAGERVPQFWFAAAIMTIDKSLKVKMGSISNRNVLSRAERLQKLKEAERWKDGDSVYGLPKTRVFKVSLKKKKKAKGPEEAAAGGAAKPAAGGAAAKPAAGAAKPAAKK